MHLQNIQNFTETQDFMSIKRAQKKDLKVYKVQRNVVTKLNKSL